MISSCHVLSRRKRGFTLIELIVVVAIVGILASAAYPLASMVALRAKESELRIALRQIRQALDDYKQAWEDGKIERKVGASGYPPNLLVLVEGVPNVQLPTRPMIYFLRRLPRDPMAPDSSIPAEDTWAIRSYSSPPDNPQEGEDVYDVMSKSTTVGLNGIPYNEW